jgi:hypothetical protein
LGTYIADDHITIVDNYSDPHGASPVSHLLPVPAINRIDHHKPTHDRASCYIRHVPDVFNGNQKAFAEIVVEAAGKTENNFGKPLLESENENERAPGPNAFRHCEMPTILANKTATA